MEVDKGTSGSEIVQTSSTEISFIGTDQQIKSLGELRIKLAEAQLATAEFGAESETIAEKWRASIALIEDSTKDGIESWGLRELE